MEFSLFLKTLIVSKGDKKAKHKIRLLLDPQLQVLWSQKPLLELLNTLKKDRSKYIKKVGTQYYLPLVTKDLHLFGEVNITILRKGKTGDLICGGDIDNKLKTLLDSMRMPNDKNEIVEIEDNSIDNPLYCVFEDDRLISSLKINTKQYLVNGEGKENILLIDIVVKKDVFTYENMNI